MKLYTFSPAPNPQRVGFMLKHKGIDLDTIEINLLEKEQFSSEFQAVNPQGTVPALLLDDGTLLTDSIAICVYLDGLFPEKSLFGANTLEYAQVIGWLHKLYTEGFMPIADMLRNQGDFFKNRAMPGKIDMPQISALIERGKLRLDGFWQAMEEHLSDREFIVGKQLTQADIDCFVLCSFAGWAKESIPENCTTLVAWHARMTSLLA